MILNRSGTKGILHDINKERALRKLIVEYDEKLNTKSKITYKNIYEFIKSEFSNGKIDFYPGYTWWKTKGKHLVDEYNVVKKRTVYLSEKEELDVFDVLDIVEKHCGNKAALIKYLTPYSDLLDRVLKKLNKLQISSQNYISRIETQNNEIQRLEQVNKNQQALLDSLFYNIIADEKNLENIMGTHDEGSRILNYALTETFGNPAAYIEAYRERRDKCATLLNNKKANIVNLKLENNLIEEDEDYDY
ncbi:hypothetical protein [Priestia aryabhattai]|uniref:hypothetical protein n=1 Tax=Priestia aryabhattai TaxID=412384 RepID=UPI001FD7A432|nr:hypothetical protein [Priestia aryabhattai]